MEDFKFADWMWQAPLFGFMIIFAICYVTAGLYAVDEWERRPVLRLGRFSRIIGPGLCWVTPWFNTVLGAEDMRDDVWSYDVENVPTHDNVRLSVTIVLTTKLISVEQFIRNVSDGWDAVEQRGIAAVTEAVGKTTLDDFLQKREEVGDVIEKDLFVTLRKWGIELIAMEIRDFKISDENTERAIAMKAKAEKEAQAELVRANMQREIALALAKAGAAMTDQAWKLKGMETLIELCRSAENNTILIPTHLQDIMATIGGITRHA